MVYDDAEKLYAEVRKDGQDLLEEATAVLLPNSTSLSAEALARSKGEIIGINTTFFPRREIVEVPLSSANSYVMNQVIHTSKDMSKGYALLNCLDGGHLAKPSGFFSDCRPVSGTSLSYICPGFRLPSRSVHQRLRPLCLEELCYSADCVWRKDHQPARRCSVVRALSPPSDYTTC